MEYQKCLAKLHSDKTKFDEVVSKGAFESCSRSCNFFVYFTLASYLGKASAKKDSLKSKVQDSAERLHRTHNEYVLSLKEVSSLQRDYSRTLLPNLLDSQQEIQETFVNQWSEEHHSNLTRQ